MQFLCNNEPEGPGLRSQRKDSRMCKPSGRKCGNDEELRFFFEIKGSRAIFTGVYFVAGGWSGILIRPLTGA